LQYEAWDVHHGLGIDEVLWRRAFMCGDMLSRMEVSKREGDGEVENLSIGKAALQTMPPLVATYY
jgi:hypothetical protein